MPHDYASQTAAGKAKITVQPTVTGTGKVVIQRKDGEAPTADITLDYLIIKVDNPEAPPKAALIGVDAYEESGYVTDEELEGAVTAALTSAKESGEFEGRRGYSVLTVKSSTSVTSASGTGTNGMAIKYKASLASVCSDASVDEVYVGDTILRASVYMYPVVKVDESYIYLGALTSIKGANGDDYTLTDADKEEIADFVLAALPASEEVAV